jgi:hypothetical protein
MKPHKHAELIKAWADGAEIEYRENDSPWFSAPRPVWNDWQEYRIKPEPKPDIEAYTRIDRWHKGSTASTKWRSISIDYLPGDNLKLTFDGESNKLKSSEVLK